VSDSSTEPVDRLGLAVILRMHLHQGVSEAANPTDLLVRIAKLVTSVPAAFSHTPTRLLAPPSSVSTAGATVVTPATITQSAQVMDAAVITVPQATTTHTIQHSVTILPPCASNKNEFFDNIASQTFLLMTDTVRRSGSAALEEGSSYVLRVCVLMTARIAHMAPDSAHTHIFLPLADMLKPAGKESRGEGRGEGEGRLSTCVRVLHWVVTCFTLSSPVLQALSRTDIMASLLSLQVYLISSTFVIASDMKGLVAEICVSILRHVTDPPVIVHTLEDVITNGLKYGYRRGSNEGILVVTKSSAEDTAAGGGEVDLLSSLLREAESSCGVDYSAEDPARASSSSAHLVSFAAQMNGVIQRTQAVCQILSTALTLSPSLAAGEGGDGDDNHSNSDGGSKEAKDQNVSVSNGSSYRVNKKKSPSLLVDQGDDEQENKAARITSLLFLRTLSGYLALTVSQETPPSSAAGGEAAPPLPPPHICGAALLILKSNMSLDVLLHDASEIIKLLGLFLQKRAEDIARTTNHNNPHQSFSFSGDGGHMQHAGESEYVHSLVSSRGGGGSDERPLIEEITTAGDDETRQKGRASKRKESARDDGNAFKSLNKVPLFGGNEEGGEEQEEGEEEEEEEDIITTVLALLVSMLQMGSGRRGKAEEALLRETLLPHLVVIAGQDRNIEVAQTASDLCLIIMTRNTDVDSTQNDTSKKDNITSSNPTSSGASSFHDVCREAKRDYIFDESPAMRGLGVRHLIVALREPPHPLTEADLQEASSLLLHLLQDKESFVYLNVIHAIGRLIDHHRDKLFNSFLSIYSEGIVRHAPLGRSRESQPSSAQEYSLSLRHRAVLSEALGCALRRADQMAHQYVPQVVAVCLRICRRRTDLQSTLNSINSDENSNGENLVDVDLTAMRVSVVTVEKGEGDESDKETARDIAKRENVVQEVCLSADEVLFRQSAFSLLAEAIGLAGLTVRQYLMDVVDVAVGALRMETATVNNGYKNLKDVVSVRRSAVFLLRYIVSGLEKQVYTLSDVGSHFKAIYRALKLAARDKDDVVKFHAECALGDVDCIMRGQLTLSEEQLTGENLPKIRVIH
jgi:hypothetical protein